MTFGQMSEPPDIKSGIRDGHIVSKPTYSDNRYAYRNDSHSLSVNQLFKLDEESDHVVQP